MAAHGYRRETSDVDLVMPLIIGTPSGTALEDTAQNLGFTIRAKHGFGGLDLRDEGIRIDILTLDRDVPTIVPDAVEEATWADRTITLFGETVFVVSLGHLIALKLVAERKKDLGDIVELLKARIEAGTWDEDRPQVAAVIKAHLGWYAVRTLDKLVTEARAELD